MVNDGPRRFILPQKQRDARLAACRACAEHFRPATQQCGRCDCVMPLKTWLKAATCPIGRWDAVD